MFVLLFSLRKTRMNNYMGFGKQHVCLVTSSRWLSFYAFTHSKVNPRVKLVRYMFFCGR